VEFDLDMDEFGGNHMVLDIVRRSPHDALGMARNLVITGVYEQRVFELWVQQCAGEATLHSMLSHPCYCFCCCCCSTGS
jgi:hypothetical protein